MLDSHCKLVEQNAMEIWYVRSRSPPGDTWATHTARGNTYVTLRGWRIYHL
jgi:hypothetical protein